MALTDIACRNAKFEGKPKKLSDEKGMYLLINSTGKYWRWDYRFFGKRRTMALGIYPDVLLGEARARRDDERKKLAAGEDPMFLRKTEKLAKHVAVANTFEMAAREWHKSRAKKWAPVTSAKVLNHLENDIFNVIGKLPLKSIKAIHVKAALQRVVDRGAIYTASRLKELCGQVFRYAISNDWAETNPVAALRNTIEPPAAVHRPALTDTKSLQVFLQDLKAYESADRLTLCATKLALLTFVRSQELRLATWDEVDFAASEWRIPAGRMKTGKGLSHAHVVPLSAQALAELQTVKAMELGGRFIFPSAYGSSRHMSENTIGRLLIRLGYQGKQSLHGFRASARTILHERGWSEAALERQLDHKETNAVKAAYARGQHLPERRRLMADWGALVEALERGTELLSVA